MPAESGSVSIAASCPKTPGCSKTMTRGETLEVDEQAHSVLEDNAGDYLSPESIAAETDYSEGYVRKRLHFLEERDDTNVVKERRYKEIFGVIIANNFVPITDDREKLLKIVKKYQPSKYGKATAMTDEELRSYITNELADMEVTSDTDMLFFTVKDED